MFSANRFFPSGVGPFVDQKSALKQLCHDVSNYLGPLSDKRGNALVCVQCGTNHRDVSNLRYHLVQHMDKRGDLFARVNNFVFTRTVKIKAGLFMCLLCQKMLKMRKSSLMCHFIAKHLHGEQAHSK